MAILNRNIDSDGGHGSQKKYILYAVYAIVLIAAVAFGGLQYKQYHDLKKNPNKAQQSEVTRVTNEVGKLYKLPNETPTLATVQDISKLKSQPFFQNAQNGDKLLIYQGARQAIIYRESSNQMVNVGPIAISSDNATNTAPAGTTATPPGNDKKAVVNSTSLIIHTCYVSIAIMFIMKL